MKFFISLLIFSFLASCTTLPKNDYSTIEYEAGACFGFCPMFKLTVKPDRTAVIEAERFTFTEGHSKDDINGAKEGTFTATLSEQNYTALVSKLDKLNLSTMKTKYGDRNVTDLPTAKLTVTYADGSTKYIEDYGKNGTPQLAELWTFIEDLRKSEQWSKVQ